MLVEPAAGQDDGMEEMRRSCLSRSMLHFVGRLRSSIKQKQSKTCLSALLRCDDDPNGRYPNSTPISCREGYLSLEYLKYWESSAYE